MNSAASSEFDALETVLDLLASERYWNVSFLGAPGDPLYDAGRAEDKDWVCQVIPRGSRMENPYAWGATRTAAARALYDSIYERIISGIPPLTLHLTPHWRSTLANLLSWAVSAQEGSQLNESFSAGAVWGGDLERFIADINDPVMGEGASPSRDEPGQRAIDLTPAEVHSLRGILTGLSESWAGGVPWPRLTAAQRGPIVEVLERLG